VVWVKDTEQILVVDTQSQRHRTLRDKEAVVWELLAVGYPYERLVTMLALVFSLTTSQAESVLTEMVHKWHEERLVCREVDGG
jgi:hypothetical protein